MTCTTADRRGRRRWRKNRRSFGHSSDVWHRCWVPTTACIERWEAGRQSVPVAVRRSAGDAVMTEPFRSTPADNAAGGGRGAMGFLHIADRPEASACLRLAVGQKTGTAGSRSDLVDEEMRPGRD